MSGPLETGAFPEEGAGAGPGPSQALAGADGKDLVKRARAVKGRFLFAFGGLLQAFAPGRFGALAGLDSPQPVLYVEFPQGRLKLFGALVSPKATNYALLNVEDHRNRKDQVLIEEVFESLVVFSEAWWVGTPEENPDEEQLPVPDAVRRAGGAGADEAGPGADVYECGAVDCSLPPLASNVKRKAGVTFEPGVGQGAAGGEMRRPGGGPTRRSPRPSSKARGSSGVLRLRARRRHPTSCPSRRKIALGPVRRRRHLPRIRRRRPSRRPSRM